MKKYNTFKVLGFVALVTILLSYFIPQTSISYGQVTTGDINPVGVIDTFSNVITAFNVFVSPFLFILIIGVFYGILKKSGSYDAVTSSIASSFSKNKGLYVIVSVLLFGIFTAIFGDMLVMLIFVPLAISVARKLGYDKKSSIAMTIGAIILGSAGSLYTNLLNQMLSTDVETNLLYKIIILLVGLISMIVFVLIFNKPQETKELKKENGNKLPIYISFITILVFLILGMTSWSTYFGFKGFDSLFKSITEYKVFKVSLYKAFVGSSLTAWGTWQLFDVFVLVAVVSLILAIVYKVRFDTILEVGASAIKKAIPYAFILIIANVILVNTYSSGWFVTVIKFLAGKKFNLGAGIISSMVSGIVYPDYTYGLQFTITTIQYTLSKSKDFYEILALVYQSIYSIMLLIAPTSVLVLLGLYHLNVRYIDWLKYIIKYFLILLVADIIILVIVLNGASVPVIFGIVVLVIVVGYLIYNAVIKYLQYDRLNKINNGVNKITKEIVKEEKVEAKKEVETKKATPKKTTVKKTTTTKKTTTKKPVAKKTTKK